MTIQEAVRAALDEWVANGISEKDAVDQAEALCLEACEAWLEDHPIRLE